MKDVIFPLKEDKVQLFAYVNAIDKETCLSMYSAAIAGWDYQLVGPKSFNHSLFDADIRMNKMIAIAAVSRTLPDDTIMIFVDSMDVRN